MVSRIARTANIMQTVASAEEETQSHVRIAKMTEKELKQLIRTLKNLGYTDEEIEDILSSEDEVDWI